MRDRLYRRGKVWWCWYYDVDRKLIRETTTCTDRGAAREVLRRKEQAAQGAREKIKPYVSLKTVLDKLEAWASSNRSGEHARFIREKCAPLRARLGDETDVHTLTKTDLVLYVQARKDTSVKAPKRRKAGAATVKKELGTLRQALNLARRDGLADVDWGKIEPELEGGSYIPRKRWLTREEFDDLSYELEPERWRWVCVAVYTGARAGEVEGLEWGDIRDGMVHVRGTKTKKSDRWVPLNPKLAATLGKRGKGALVQPWPNVGRDLKAACKRAGVPPATPNDLRRTFASWLLQAGQTSSVVAELLGHSTTELVDLTYGKLSRETLIRAVDMI